MDDELKKLQLKVTELENQLKAMGSRSNIDPEDFKTFQKVSQQLGLTGCINECQPLICHGCYTCYTCFTCFRCINECICGPCNICNLGGFANVGTARFGSLG